MGNLITTFSSVEAYADSCSNEYSAIINRANEIFSRIEKLYYEVQLNADKLEQQIIQGRQFLDEVQLRLEKYQALMEDAMVEVARCDEQIAYIYSHPIKRTCAADDGNEYTVEEVDEMALAVAQRAREQAQDIYEQFRNKYDEATKVMLEIDSTIIRFETIKHGINTIIQIIQTDIFEIKKYINAIANESEYNLQALQGTIDSIARYLSSKPINMPVRTTYFVYSGSGGGSASHKGTSGNGNIVLDKITNNEDAFMSADDMNNSVASHPNERELDSKNVLSNCEVKEVNDNIITVEGITDYKWRIDKTPINNGKWLDELGNIGVRGESKWCPNDECVRLELEKFGIDGIKYKNGYPDFSKVSYFGLYLKENEFLDSDRKQFERCNQALFDILEENPEFVKGLNLDEGQKVDLMEGRIPYGYTWHHDPNERGLIMLVPTSIHQACRHFGGRSVWGGGAEYR